MTFVTLTGKVRQNNTHNANAYFKGFQGLMFSVVVREFHRGRF